jgi:3',5'-cyclic AMP phosphodiesterase CpdA
VAGPQRGRDPAAQAATAAARAATAAAAGSTFAEAEQIHLTFGADPSTEMAVSWVTPSPVADPRVVARLVASGVTEGVDLPEPATGVAVEAAATTRQFTDAHTGGSVLIHHALLTGLEPDRRYTYEIHGTRADLPGAGRSAGSFDAGGRRAGAGAGAPGGTLRTAPAGRAAFTFTSVGDQGSPNPVDSFGSPFAAKVTAGLERIAPMLHLATGDLSYANMSDDRVRTWRNWFAAIEPSASRRPWMPAAGNHEVELGNGPLGFGSYQARFRLPDSGEPDVTAGLWYTFAVGGVRFVALDADDVCYQPGEPALYLRGYSGGRQTAWLERTLKDARSDPGTDWIVVFTHQAFASTAALQNGCDLGIREEWGPLFDAYGVDLVLCGHDHHYERTHPVRGTLPASPTLTPRPVATRTDVIDTTQGTVHVLVGFGGAEHPSNEHLFDPPAASVVVGVRPDESGGGLSSVRIVEPAAWSAVRGLAHAYGFARFDVDPGKPGGLTTIRATVYDVTGDEPVAFDHFTLTRPRADA